MCHGCFNSGKSRSQRRARFRDDIDCGGVFYWPEEHKKACIRLRWQAIQLLVMAWVVRIYAMRASVHACDKQQQQHGMKRECIRITVPLDAAGVKHDAGAGYYRCGGG